MPTPSANHGFDLGYQPGDSWDYNDEFEALEQRVTVRDVEAELASYTPQEGDGFPNNSEGYRVAWRPDNDYFRLQVWSGGSLMQSDSVPHPTLSYGDWHYADVSYLNPNDAGANTVEAKIITAGGQTIGPVSVSNTVVENDSWSFEEHWGWDTIHYGGIEVIGD